MVKKCSIDGCEKSAIARGWCTMHWNRWQKRGDPCAPRKISLRRTKPIEDRFWAKVKKTDGCWLWTASATRGYGELGLGRSGEGNIRASHLSWILANGPIPDGLFVLHKCDNPPCVRPDHLFLGSQKDNLEDASAKGRVARGERHYKTKLREWDICNIRAVYAAGGITQLALAKFFDVSRLTVSGIVNGRSWKHIP